MEILLNPLKTIPLLLVLSGMAFGQANAPGCSAISPDAALRQFDVASVKPAEPLTPPLSRESFAMRGGPGTNDPGRFTVAHTSLSNLIMRAWGIDYFDQLKGPSWLNNANGGYSVSATMPASTTQEEFCGMLRNLMAARFHLTFHYEKQPRPGYELAVMAGGPKFREFVPAPAAPDEGPGRGSDADGFPILSPSQPTAMAFNVSRTGATKESFRNNMAEFARRLAADVNQSNGAQVGPGSPMPRVVDKTGLAGIYDIRLEYAGMPFPVPPVDGAPAPAAPDPGDAGPNIFNAVQQQLGLKLTKIANIQVDVMIIDHVDQTPTEN
jgi:uncharacterized protein (TIGR03435 family)